MHDLNIAGYFSSSKLSDKRIPLANNPLFIGKRIYGISLKYIQIQSESLPDSDSCRSSFSRCSGKAGNEGELLPLTWPGTINSGYRNNVCIQVLCYVLQC